MAVSKERYSDEFSKKITYTGFSALQVSWRAEKLLAEVTSVGEIMVYLDKKISDDYLNVKSNPATPAVSRQKRTVAENVGYQYKLPESF